MGRKKPYGNGQEKKKQIMKYETLPEGAVPGKKARSGIMRGLAWILILQLLSGCGMQSQAETVPPLLDPVEIALTGKEVVKGNIQDIEAYKGSVKSGCISYAFPQNCYVEDMRIHVGEFVNKGDLIARVNTESYEKESADLQAEITYLEKMNEIEKSLAENEIKNKEIDLNQINSKTTYYDDMKKEIEMQVKKKDFEAKEREFAIADKQTKWDALCQQNASRDLYASESGYVTYVKEFASDNPSGYVNAGEIVAVVLKQEDYVITSTMPLVTAREADFVYAQIDGKEYELTYVPYEDSQLKWAANEGITLESRFVCKEDITSLAGSDVTVYAVSHFRENVLSISPDALFTENNVNFVYVIEDGQKVKREVQTGVHTQNAVEIVEGIKEGDEVYCQYSDLPGSQYSLVTVEKSTLDITKRFDTAKLAYPLSTKIVNTADGAKIKEIFVKNGQEVKKGDRIAVLEGEGKNSALMENSSSMAALKRSYDYEMALYQKEMEKLQKQKEEMTEQETTYTAAYKKLVLEMADLQLNIQKETLQYTYETERLQREYEQNRKENGQITITAQTDGVIKEMTSMSEGDSIAKDTMICRIVDPNFTCIKLFADGVKPVAGTNVSIVRGIMDGELSGTVVSSVPDVRSEIYPEGRYIREDSSQSKDAIYIVLENEGAYDKLGSFGVKINIWDVENAIVTDRDCIYTNGDGSNGKRYVWVSKDGQLSKRYVTVGYLDNDVAWIVQGLSEGEQIVLEKAPEEAE